MQRLDDMVSTHPDGAEKMKLEENDHQTRYELESERKSSAAVVERRKQLTKIVASTVGVAWFICIAAVGETALRALLFH